MSYVMSGLGSDCDYDYYDLDDDDRSEFENPWGNSSLRAETENNPRNLPCPNCGEPNQLTKKDRALHYQCDACANQAERGF